MSINYSFVKTEEELAYVRSPGAGANFFNQEKLQMYWTCDEAVARKVLPPHVEPFMPFGVPVVCAYLANYCKPETLYSYPESALFLLAQCKGYIGVYCLSMTLCGSDQASDGGREFYGYPKKQGNVRFCRSGDRVFGYAERNYIRFFEMEATIGAPLNDPVRGPAIMGTPGAQDEIGDVLLLKYDLDTCIPEGGTNESQGLIDTFVRPRVVAQHNITKYLSKDMARIEHMNFKASEDDPWIELMPPTEQHIFGAFYTHFETYMQASRLAHMYGAEEIPSVQPYLWLGWDTSMLGKEHTALARIEA